MSLLVLRETPSSAAPSSFDIPGIAALSGALFLLIFGLIKGPDYGWASARTLAFLGAAALAGLLFVIRQSRAWQPLLPVRLFRSASLSAREVLVVLLMFAVSHSAQAAPVVMGPWTYPACAAGLLAVGQAGNCAHG